jgi:lipoate-protein ligase B|tara:strand:+ start:89 stop:709 length:621 start_codon:yes stop_codon:yes gene_type:complete
MTIEIKKSKKPIDYMKAMSLLEKRMLKIHEKKENELIWILKHPNVFTGGTSYQKNEILDKSIKILKTNRGGKITYHGPGQIIIYFVLDLKKRNNNIRKLILIIEKTIIETLKSYNIDSFSDRKNIGIWVNHEDKIKKIAAIGIKVKKWIAYHGFSINIDTNLNNFEKIIPCGIKDKEVSNLKVIKKQDYSEIGDLIVEKFIKYLET